MAISEISSTKLCNAGFFYMSSLGIITPRQELKLSLARGNPQTLNQSQFYDIMRATTNSIQNEIQNGQIRIDERKNLRQHLCQHWFLLRPGFINLFNSIFTGIIRSIRFGVPGRPIQLILRLYGNAVHIVQWRSFPPAIQTKNCCHCNVDNYHNNILYVFSNRHPIVRCIGHSPRIRLGYIQHLHITIPGRFCKTGHSVKTVRTLLHAV